jgi:hypothetical protein
MSEMRFKTAVIIEVEVVAENDIFIVIGKVGERHPNGWQYTGENRRLSVHSDFESAYARYKKMSQTIRQHGSIPKTVRRDLDSYLLP